MLVYMIPIHGAPPGWDTFPKPQPPGQPPVVGHPEFPTHPIALPPLPPGMPMPPGLGGTPENPIYYPPQVWPQPPHGGGPVDPGWGVRPPVDPGYDRPEGGRPDHGLPKPPSPGAPTHPIVIPGTPANPIATPPGQVWPPLTDLRTKSWTLAWLPGYGYRWVSVEPAPPRPGQPIAPTPAPKA